MMDHYEITEIYVNFYKKIKQNLPISCISIWLICIKLAKTFNYQNRIKAITQKNSEINKIELGIEIEFK